MAEIELLLCALGGFARINIIAACFSLAKNAKPAKEKQVMAEIVLLLCALGGFARINIIAACFSLAKNDKPAKEKQVMAEIVLLLCALGSFARVIFKVLQISMTRAARRSNSRAGNHLNNPG